jgi:hypothetical protein
MKPTSTSSSPQRPRSFHSPDHYPSRQKRSFRDANLGGFLIALLGAVVAFGVALVMQ